MTTIAMKTIITPRQAVDYARLVSTPAGLQIGVTIHLDAQGRPLPYGFSRSPKGECHPSKSVIIVKKNRNGDCIPSSRTIDEAGILKDLWSQQGRTLLDIIIIGHDGFYSFAEERIIKD